MNSEHTQTLTHAYMIYLHLNFGLNVVSNIRLTFLITLHSVVVVAVSDTRETRYWVAENCSP